MPAPQKTKAHAERERLAMTLWGAKNYQFLLPNIS